MQPSPFMLGTALVIGLVSALFAQRLNRNPYLWFAIGFFFGLFGIFAVLFASKKVTLKKPLLPKIIGPKDKFWYYLNEANEQQGPMSFDALTKHWEEKRIELKTLIWHEELKNWTPLAGVLTKE